MANRAINAGLLDANSQSPVTFTYSPLVNTNTTTTITAAGAGVFRGFLVIAAGSGSWGATVYDATPSGTLNSTTAIGVLSSTTASGFVPFQWGGDIIYQNGLTLITTQTTAGAIKVIYL